MTDNAQSEENVWSYVRNEMPSDERRAFERLMASDDAFRKRVEDAAYTETYVKTLLHFSKADEATIEGAIMSASGALNQAYYGRPVRSVEILNQNEVANSGADSLRATVARIAGGPSIMSVPALPASEVDYDLLTIEEALSAQGFDPGAVDGILSPATQGAIRRFQDYNGYPVTGVPSLELQRQLAN